MTIQRVHIKNFKSVVDLSLDLGLVNVFIGENGSGKSNILEALAFAGAAAANKLDNEFLASRGIRVTELRFMRSAFADDLGDKTVVEIEDEGGLRVKFEMSPSGDANYPRWIHRNDIEVPTDLIQLPDPAELYRMTSQGMAPEYQMSGSDFEQMLDAMASTRKSPISDADKLKLKSLFSLVMSPVVETYKKTQFSEFIIYSPEVSALRVFEKEGQILPLGVRGEGLLKLLRVLATEDPDSWRLLQDSLGLLDWLAGVDLDHDDTLPEQSIRLRDRFVSDALPAFDQRSANEGFLYLLFFFALVLSKATPRLFAIENVDTSLNPKACSELMRRLATLAIERQKQILFTTHNPSLLDGLNLHDDNQRLFVVSRNRDGHTTARRIQPPRPVGDELPIRLSEAFTRGLLGGIPQNF